MNAKMFLGGAVALSLAFAVWSASADDVQKYGATFESAVSATPGEMNDWAYALGTNVTTYANTAGETYGWFGAADDASTIIAANNGQALRVDTGSSILTKKRLQFSGNSCGLSWLRRKKPSMKYHRPCATMWAVCPRLS